MKKGRFLSIVILLAICLIGVSCSGGDTEKTVDTTKNASVSSPPSANKRPVSLVPIAQYPLAGEPIEKKFMLVFDKKIHFPSEVPVVDYIKTNPPLKGITDCIENTLVFNLLEPVPENINEIEFCVHPQLQSEDGIPIDTQKQCYRIPTVGLKVLEGQFQDVNDSMIVFSLRFSFPVLPQEIKPFISITNQNDSNVEFELDETNEPSDLVLIRIKRVETEPYKLILKPGYINSEKRYKGQAAYFEFPLQESLSVLECKRADYSRVEIAFSRPVASDVIYSHIQIFSSDAHKCSFTAAPLDWGKVNEMAINNPPTNSDLIEKKVSKSWALYVHDLNTLDNVYIMLVVMKNTWSEDFSILPTEYSWSSSASSKEFKVDYAYWRNKGLDGVSYSLSMPKIEEETAINYLEIIPPVDNLSIQKTNEYELEIKGNWKTGIKYILKWKAGLKWGMEMTSFSGLTYKILENDYVYTMRELPEFKTLDFDNKDKFYIIPFHEKNFIRVGSRNVSKGYLHVYQVITENLPVWLGNTSSNNVPFEINEKTTRYITAIPIEFPNSADNTSYVDVDLTQHLANYSKGIFTLCLSDEKDPGKLRANWEIRGTNNKESGGYEEYEYDYYNYNFDPSQNENRLYADINGTRSSIRYILWTRLGVVSHWDNTSLVGFVHDLIDLSPQAGAVVSAYSIKNDKVAEGTTDNNGIFKFLLDNQDAEKPRLITIKTRNDFTFVFLTPKPLPTLKDLEKYENYDRNKYDAFIYTDRNLYRPGELIHSRWIVRSNYGSEVINAPLELRFVNPQNKVVQRKVVSLSEWGTGGEDIATETTYLTGTYTLGLYVPGGEQICGSIPVHVEDFVPDRIKVELTVPDDFWIVGTEQKFELSSQYYVGPPASNLPCKAKLIITPTTFENEKWKGYQFGNNEFFKTVVMDLGTKNTDSEGKSEFSFDFSPPGTINKPIEIAVIGEVSEVGGRAVSAVKKIKGYPEEIICGLGVEKIEDKLQVAVALVGKDFNPAPDSEVDVFLERADWSFANRLYPRNSGGTIPQWRRVFTIIEQQKVTTKDGMATAQFSIPPFYQTYRVRVQRTGGKTFSDMSFYCVPQKILHLEEGPPELVKIHIEDKKWQVGESVPVSVEVPFDGKAVAVIQGDSVWDAQVFDIVSGKGAFSLNIEEKYFPNVWVGVSAIHVPAKEDMISPYSTFSYAKVEIEKPQQKLNIVFTKIPEEIEPQNTTELNVQTTTFDGKPISAELTIAAVDEGIHAILGYTLPDPYTWFGRPRYSPIWRVHYYDHVAYDYDPSSPSGDMIARQLSAGKPEIGESWIKPVALWSGVIKTDEQGFAKVAFNLPEFNGTLRIVAVGANKELFGSTESKMLVRRPCVIQTQLPRFLRPQDNAIIFARSLNSQENPLDVKLTLTPNESISIQPVTLQWESPPKGLGISPDINIVCLSGANNAQLQWQYNITNKTGDIVDQFSEQTPIPVRIPSIYEQRATTLIVPAGETLNLDTSDFVEDNLLATEIKISGSPFLQAEPALRWLWEYNYTCCEQKASRLYALYLFRNFLKDSMSDVISPSDYDKLLMTMLNDIFSHQQGNGGLSLWPYSSNSDIRTSLHAGFLLAMINRDKGLPIPEKPYQRLIAFLKDLILVGGGDESLSNPEIKAFATLILALDGDPVACERLNNYLKADNPRDLRVLLLLGANICGMPSAEIKKHVEQLKWETGEESSRKLWKFSSNSVRMLALQLISRVISDATPENMLEIQKPLIEYLTKHLGFTTYDLGMVLMALDMSFKKLNIQSQECTAQIKLDGIEQLVQGTKIFKNKKQGKTQIDIHNTGTTPVYAFWCIRGVSKNPPKNAESNNLNLERFVFDCKDKQETITPFKQGNTYLLLFRVQPKYDVDSLILTQLLPAGFEIENPRLKQEQMSELIPKQYINSASIIDPEHVEIRDDKLIVAYPQLQSSKNYIYATMVRAITRGSFEFPGARIEDMYKPETFARLATGQIEVK